MGQDPKTMLLFIGALFAIMYFVMIRPQQKQLKLQREMLAALKKGDEVLTQSGLVGKIYAVTEKFVQIEIANGVRVRMVKSAVQGKVQPAEDDKASEKKSDDADKESKEAK